jgi:hypothetical protein
MVFVAVREILAWSVGLWPNATHQRFVRHGDKEPGETETLNRSD